MNSAYPDTDSGIDTRDAILVKLQDGIDELYRDIEAADPATHDEKQLQLRRYHELGYLANQYRKLKRDTDLDKISRSHQRTHDLVQ
jgi:hypothetical protein